MGTAWTVQRLAKEQGMTVHAYLSRMVDAGMTLKQMYMDLGISHAAVRNLLAQYGLQARRVKRGRFEFDGQLDTLTGHCMRHALNYNCVYQRMRLHNITPQESIRHYIAKADKRETLSPFEYIQGIPSNPVKP